MIVGSAFGAGAAPPRKEMPQGNVMAFERRSGAERLLVALNLGHDTATVPMQEREGTVLLSTYLDRAGDPVREQCPLRPDEGLIVALR